MMFVFREEYYLSRGEPKQRDNEDAEKFGQRYRVWQEQYARSHNRADVIIAKQRNGPIGTVQLQFDASYGRFRNPELVDYSGQYH